MDKKTWISAEIIDLGVQNTESSWDQTDNHDGEWVDVQGHKWQKHS